MSKKALKIYGLLVFMALTALVLAKPASAAAKEMGRISIVKGNVTLLSPEKEPQSLKEGQMVHEGDRIVTGPDSKTRILLLDGSVVSVAVSTTLRLDRGIWLPKDKERNVVLNVLVGRIKCFARDLTSFRKKTFKVFTPTAVIGVRGTVFLIWVKSDNATGICALDKSVDVANIITPDEKLVLKQKTYSWILPGKAPDKPQEITDEIYQVVHEGFLEADKGMEPGM